VGLVRVVLQVVNVSECGPTQRGRGRPPAHTPPHPDQTATCGMCGGGACHPTPIDCANAGTPHRRRRDRPPRRRRCTHRAPPQSRIGRGRRPRGDLSPKTARRRAPQNEAGARTSGTSNSEPPGGGHHPERRHVERACTLQTAVAGAPTTAGGGGGGGLAAAPVAAGRAIAGSGRWRLGVDARRCQGRHDRPAGTRQDRLPHRTAVTLPRRRARPVHPAAREEHRASGGGVQPGTAYRATRPAARQQGRGGRRRRRWRQRPCGQSRHRRGGCASMHGATVEASPAYCIATPGASATPGWTWTTGPASAARRAVTSASVRAAASAADLPLCQVGAHPPPSARRGGQWGRHVERRDRRVGLSLKRHAPNESPAHVGGCGCQLAARATPPGGRRVAASPAGKEDRRVPVGPVRAAAAVGASRVGRHCSRRAGRCPRRRRDKGGGGGGSGSMLLFAWGWHGWGGGGHPLAGWGGGGPGPLGGERAACFGPRRHDTPRGAREWTPP